MVRPLSPLRITSILIRAHPLFIGFDRRSLHLERMFLSIRYRILHFKNFFNGYVLNPTLKLAHTFFNFEIGSFDFYDVLVLRLAMVASRVAGRRQERCDPSQMVSVCYC